MNSAQPSDARDGTVPACGIGIDFGTTNSAAAVFDGRAVMLVALEDPSAIMPSATYVDRAFATRTGQAAIDAYIRHNQRRRVEMSVEVLGEARTSTGATDPDTKLPVEASTDMIYGQAVVDGSLPGRLFRGTKRLLAAPRGYRLTVFDRAFRLVALITPILLRIREAVDHLRPGHAADHACIGHPVNFEGADDERNQLARRRLSEACTHAGVTVQHFYPEPTAAALSYLYACPDQAGRVILTVDFGGGTLDLCILKRRGAAFQVLATHGIALGGDHIDQQLFRALLFPLLGKGERWRREVDGKPIDTPFPFEDYEDMLLNWTISYMLNQNRYTTPVLDMIRQGGPAAVKFQRLYELITQNDAYRVFQAIKDCKAALSEAGSAVLDIPEIDVELEVTRSEFEAVIAAQLATFERAVDATLARADLRVEAVDVVLRTGGSSLIPAVKQILDRRFAGKVVEHDPFTSVAAGLAIADFAVRCGMPVAAAGVPRPAAVPHLSGGEWLPDNAAAGD